MWEPRRLWKRVRQLPSQSLCYCSFAISRRAHEQQRDHFWGLGVCVCAFQQTWLSGFLQNCCAFCASGCVAGLCVAIFSRQRCDGNDRLTHAWTHALAFPMCWVILFSIFDLKERVLSLQWASKTALQGHQLTLSHLALYSMSYAWYPDALLLHVLYKLIRFQTCRMKITRQSYSVCSVSTHSI